MEWPGGRGSVFQRRVLWRPSGAIALAGSGRGRCRPELRAPFNARAGKAVATIKRKWSLRKCYEVRKNRHFSLAFRGGGGVKRAHHPRWGGFWDNENTQSSIVGILSNLGLWVVGGDDEWIRLCGWRSEGATTTAQLRGFCPNGRDTFPDRHVRILPQDRVQSVLCQV